MPRENEPKQPPEDLPKHIDPQEADTGEVKNAQEHGRYGTAPSDAPHLEPEVPPVALQQSVPTPVPPVIPGALPENRGDDPQDINRDRGKPGPGQLTGRPVESAARAAAEPAKPRRAEAHRRIDEQL